MNLSLALHSSLSLRRQRLTVNLSSSVSQWSKICLILSFRIHMKKFFQNKKLKNTQNSCSFSVHFPIQRSEIYVPNCKCVFFVTFIHYNLLSIRISCTHILLNKKVHLYVNENLRGHLHDLKLYQIGNILHLRWRHYNFSKMDDKMENRKKGIYKHYEISIYLCNPVDLMKMHPHIILKICGWQVY